MFTAIWTFIKSIFKAILLKPIFNLLILIIWMVPDHNLGIAIIIITIIVRLALYPSSVKSLENQKKLKELEPEMVKLKEKYKGDQEGEAKATMALYQRYNINPLSSCLPVLLQLPILFILYYAMQRSVDMSRFDLLYAFTPRPDMINHFLFGIDLTKPNIYLAVVAGLLQYVQSKQMMPKKEDKKQVGPDDKKNISSQMMQNIMGNQMLYFFPIMTIWLGATLPAFLTVYWIATTLFSIGQQWWILKGRKNKQIAVTIKEHNE